MDSSQKLRFLCFGLADRIFALDIMGIREILRRQVLTQVPGSPPYVAGVVNVRGELISVLDASLAFTGQTGADNEGEDVRVILCESAGASFGVLVDSVQEVAAVGLQELSPAPSDAASAAVVAMFRKPGGDKEDVVMLVRLGTMARMARGEGDDG